MTACGGGTGSPDIGDGGRSASRSSAPLHALDGLRDDRPDGADDFDFLLGSWTVHNRVLRGRLRGSDEWDEWEATLDVAPILGGLGTVDRFRAYRRGEYFEGVSLRVFDAGSRSWRIFWMDTSHPEPTPQVTGAFQNGRGVFYGKEEFEGGTVDLRFIWETGSSETARWEQAYSDDGGKTWETNWIMDFRRR